MMDAEATSRLQARPRPGQARVRLRRGGRLGVVLLVALLAPGSGAFTELDVSRAAPRASHGLGPVVRFLARDRTAGRDNDTPESLRVQKKLIRALQRLGVGVNPDVRGPDAYRQPFTESGQSGTNLLAVMPGRELPDEYVILGAHYDHLGTRSGPSGACTSRGTPGGAVCNGATDNASSVSIVLAVGRALRHLPTPPRRSVVLALWDAEEDGLLGSLHYVRNPAVPLAATRAYVNLDIQGSDLLPSLARTSFAVGAETGGPALAGIVDDAVGNETLGTLPVSYIFGQLRSDYANFVNAGVPTVFYGDSTNGCYHTIHDDVTVVDWAKLAVQSRIAFRTVAALAETANPPTFVPPNPALATYADAVSLAEVFATARGDLALFPPADQQAIGAVGDAIEQVVLDGPAAFDAADVGTLLGAALNGIAAIQRLGCRAP